jgi:hypothetical protein
MLAGRGARGVGVTLRGEVGRSTATLIFAGRNRSSGMRRRVPRTNGGVARCRAHRRIGGLSCRGAAPERHRHGGAGHASRRVCPRRGWGHAVISAQVKPASSRAMAVMTTPVGLCRALIRR